MALIFYVSSLQQAPLPPSLSDKVGHLIAYAALGVLVTRGVSGRLPMRITWRAAALSLIVTITYGAGDELHQSFVPGRSADIYDLVADAAGGLLAVGACALWGILPVRSDLRGAAS